MPVSDPTKPTSLSNNNTNVIIGVVVSAVVVLVTIVFIVAYFIRRRMFKNEHVRNNTSEDPEPSQQLPQEAEYEREARYEPLNKLTRVPVDANYQKLLRKDQLHCQENQYENVQHF